MPGWKSAYEDFLSLHTGFRPERSEEVRDTSEEKKDQSPYLQIAALVLSFVRLIVELLK